MRDLLVLALVPSAPFLITRGPGGYEDFRLVVVPVDPAVVSVSFYRANDLKRLADPLTRPPFALVVRAYDPGIRQVLAVGSDSAGRAVEFWTVLVPIELAAPPVPPAVLATESLSAGWALVSLVLPQGTARGPLQIGDLPTQTDVKRRWPDGSLKHALLSAAIPTAGRYPVTEIDV